MNGSDRKSRRSRGKKEAEREEKERRCEEKWMKTNTKQSGTKVAKKSGKRPKSKGKRRNKVSANSSSTPSSDIVDVSKTSSSQSDKDDSDEEICQECGRMWRDDDEDSQQCWMGCDTCPRWFHYYCLPGLTGIPDDFCSCHHWIIMILCICFVVLLYCWYWFNPLARYLIIRNFCVTQKPI